MILIVYGEHKELFEADAWNVPDAIKELYAYVGGSIGENLFGKAIEGMVKTATIGDMVRFYNALALEKPIHKIFTDATTYWSGDDG